MEGVCTQTQHCLVPARRTFVCMCHFLFSWNFFFCVRWTLLLITLEMDICVIFNRTVSNNVNVVDIPTIVINATITNASALTTITTTNIICYITAVMLF